MLSLTPFFGPFFSPQIRSVLGSSPPLTSPSFSAPVEYYRTFSSTPPALSWLLPFLSKISSCSPSVIPPSAFPLSYTHFFFPRCTLTLPPRILISQSFMVTLLLSPPLNVSQFLFHSLFPSPSHNPSHPPTPPAVPPLLVSFLLLLISWPFWPFHTPSPHLPPLPFFHGSTC